MKANTSSKIFNSQYFHYALVFFFCFLFRFIPPFAVVTPYGMGIIGCFIGVIYGWSTLNMFIPSLIALVGLSLSIGTLPLIAAAFGNMTVAGMFFVFMVMGVAIEVGGIDWLVNKLLRSKLFMGKAWFTVWFFLFLCFILGNFGAIFLVLIVCQFIASLLKQIDAKPYSSLTCLLFLGVAYCLMMGQVVFPYLGLGITLTSAYTAMCPIPLDMGKYMLFGLPLGTIMTIVYVLIMRFIFRADVTPFQNLTEDVLGEAKPCTADQKKALYALLAMIVFNICSAFPFLGPLYQATAYLTMFGNAIVLLIIMGLLKRTDGTPLFDPKKASGYVAWDIILLTAFIMVISNYMTASETGIMDSLFIFLQPMTQFSPWIFVVLLIAVAAIITNFANNLVLTIALLPFMITYLTQVGLSPTGPVILFFISCQMALCTPGGSPMTAVAFSMKDWVEPKMMMHYGLYLLPLLLFFDLLFGIPLSIILF